jgi:tetratricopeptide (TPR) repeat protein
MMRRSLRTFLLAAGSALAAVVALRIADAQDAPPAPAVADTLSADAHRVRGILAWRKAVWASDTASYLRAVRELEASRRLAQGAPDVTAIFVLGFCRARTGDPAGALEMVREGRAAAPGFPAHLLTEAVARTGSGPGWRKQDGTQKAVATLDQYLVEIARYPPKAAFAAELRYLGFLERGLRLLALDEHDRAIRDLDAARALAASEGRTPSVELVRMLSQCHKSLQQFQLAESFLNESLHRDPGEPSHYHMLALLAADSNRRDDARLWNQRAVLRRLDYLAPRGKLAYLAWEAGDLDGMRRQLEATAYLSRFAADSDVAASKDAGPAANLHAGWGKYWFARGERLVEAGNAEGAARHWERARDEYREALRAQPGCIRTIVGLVEVLSRLRAPPEEIESLRKRLDDMRAKKPNTPEMYTDTFC